MIKKKKINKEKSSFEFIGYILAGIKSEKGTFNKWSGTLTLKDGKITGLEATAKTNSVNTRFEKLTQHLKSKDFFDVAKYPEIKFKSKSIKDNQLIGNLTFHGKTKSITFPVKITKNSISADFKVDTKPFGLKYAGVKKQVRIIFNFVI